MGSHPIRVISEIRGNLSLLTDCSVGPGAIWAENEVMGTETTDGSDSTDERGRQRTARERVRTGGGDICLQP
ncbi:MAG: hypothetical protein ACQESR_30255 [Planctomycetota bacterium]